jgi:hypothetical protein
VAGRRTARPSDEGGAAGGLGRNGRQDDVGERDQQQGEPRAREDEAGDDRPQIRWGSHLAGTDLDADDPEGDQQAAALQGFFLVFARRLQRGQLPPSRRSRCRSRQRYGRLVLISSGFNPDGATLRWAPG